MNVRTVWWWLLAAGSVMLCRHLWVYWQHRRRNTPLPQYATGEVSASIGFVLLCASALLETRTSVVWILLAASLLFLGVSIALSVIAKRRT